MMSRGTAVVALVALLASAARAPPAPEAPDWRGIPHSLVQAVCVPEAGTPLIGASPLDEPGHCPRHRDLGVGERLPYHKHDWAETRDRAAYPDGVHRSDSFPIRTRRLG